MKTIGKILHFYVVCSTCCLILTWISAYFVFDSYVMGVGIIITFFIWSPIYTLVLTLVHILKINTKILGNIYYEIIVSLLPSLLNYIYFTIAYKLTNNYFVMSTDGRVMSRKWFLNFSNVEIMIYIFVFILLVIHGRINIPRNISNDSQNKNK